MHYRMFFAMNREIAIRLDTFLISIIDQLEMTSDFLQNNTSKDEHGEYLKFFGHCFSNLIEFSEMLREHHTGITPPSLRRDA